MCQFVPSEAGPELWAGAWAAWAPCAGAHWLATGKKLADIRFWMDTTETIPPGRGGPLAPARALPRLRLIYTTRAGIIENGRFALPVGPNLIGRHKEDLPGLVLTDDDRVSRRHALVRVVETTLEASVEDLGSKNGTEVNGQRISSAVVLQDGDVLRVGDSWLIVRYESPRTGPRSARAGDGALAELVGISPVMAELREYIQLIAHEPSPVLILGETGTGKELVANALHRLSKRAGELLAVNCSAVPEALAESLFFGTTTGSFTGAAAKPGYLRAAHGGTLLLDEVGDLPSSLQPKLLRVIDKQEVLPIGETRAVHCDVRFISATHRELLTEITQERFRQDLYARLSYQLIRLSPLRQRREDILHLLRHSLRQASAELPTLPPELVDALLLHPWPQNAREVQQVALHLRQSGPDNALFDRLRDNAALARATLRPPLTIPQPASESPALTQTRPWRAPLPNKKELTGLLHKHGGVVRHVAQELGCSRRHVGRLIEDHKIDLNSIRTGSEVN